ncbi:hypothetical protein [Streptomyces sp. NPDC059176]|uniref:hypothetical protein n=1 Tax=unclassified Streptomyces TaxID=2593676 RepID=UPI00367C0B03
MSHTTQAPRHVSGLRDARYGEVVLITPDKDGSLRAAVYNTLGLNDCPPEWWDALNPQALAEEFDVPAVILNGPRFWVVDEITAYEVGGTETFDGLEARLVAQVPLPAGRDVSGPDKEYYADIVVRRDTEYVFAAGKPVYSLLAPDGKTYVMQTYAHIVDDSLTMASLSALGERLRLPEGWRFRVHEPDEDLHVRTVDGEAHVVQDDLENTYMLVVD